jgi:integrase
MSVEYVDLDTVKIALTEDGSFYSPKPTHKPKIHVSWIERPSGRIRYRSTGTDDRALAQAFLSAFISANQRADAEAAESPIEEINQLYLAEKRLKGEAQDYYLRPFVRAFGKRLFSTLTKKDLIVYRHLREEAPGRHGKPLDYNTVRGHVKAIEALRNWAKESRMIPKRLHDDLVPIDIPPRTAPKKPKALEEAETDRLWGILVARVDSDGRLSKVARWAAIAIDTGARKLAVERLTWAQVHFEEGYIDFVLPKSELNDKRHAKVPMSPRLRVFLLQARAQAISDFVLDQSDYDTERAWDRALKGTEFEGINQHLLRHSWATQQLKRGTDLYHVAKALGDNPLQVIARYEHLLPNHINLRWGPKASAMPMPLSTAAE